MYYCRTVEKVHFFALYNEMTLKHTHSVTFFHLKIYMRKKDTWVLDVAEISTKLWLLFVVFVSEYVPATDELYLNVMPSSSCVLASKTFEKDLTFENNEIEHISVGISPYHVS